MTNPVNIVPLVYPEHRIRAANGMSLDNIGARLVGWRTQHNVTQADLATLLGVTQASVSHWENGQPPIQPAMLVLAMRALSLEFK